MRVGIKIENMKNWYCRTIGVSILTENLWNRCSSYIGLHVGEVKGEVGRFDSRGAVQNSGISKTDAPPGATGLVARRQRREMPLHGGKVQFCVLGGLMNRGCGKIKLGIGSLLFRRWRKCKEVRLSGNLSTTITKLNHDILEIGGLI